MRSSEGPQIHEALPEIDAVNSVELAVPVDLERVDGAFNGEREREIPFHLLVSTCGPCCNLGKPL